MSKYASLFGARSAEMLLSLAAAAFLFVALSAGPSVPAVGGQTGGGGGEDPPMEPACGEEVPPT